jgi:hypothetical protein
MIKKAATTRKKTTTTKRITKKTTTRAKSTKSVSSTTKKSAKPTKAAKKSTTTKKYSPLAQKEVAKEIRRYKKGTAKSGKAETPVKSRAQAIAIGLSKARDKGAKVPKKRS